MKIKRKIISLLCASTVCLFSAVASADSCKPTTCPTTCSASANSNCNKKFDAGCMIAKNKQVEGGSCFNNVPISSADYSSDQCSSADKNSELGTNFPITPSSPSDIVAVKSAAKGKVIYAGVTVDGGRTVIIEHTKACDDTGHGDTGKSYHISSFTKHQCCHFSGS